MILVRPLAVIETKNLRLRRMEEKDAGDIFRMRSDPRMHTYTDSKPDASIDDTMAYIARMSQGISEGRWAIWVLEHLQCRRVIGTVCFWNLNTKENSAEIGFGIIPEFQNRGLMKEALLAAIGYASQIMRIAILKAYTEDRNIPSRCLLERCGFSETGSVDEPGSQNGRVYRMVIYERTGSGE